MVFFLELSGSSEVLKPYLTGKDLLARKNLGNVVMRRGASTSSATAPLAVAELVEAELVEAELVEAEPAEAMRLIPELLRAKKIPHNSGNRNIENDIARCIIRHKNRQCQGQCTDQEEPF